MEVNLRRRCLPAAVWDVSAVLRIAGVRMRLFFRLLKQPVPKHIERYSRFSPSPLSIKQFLDFGECDALRPAAPKARGSEGVTIPPPSVPPAGLFSLNEKSMVGDGDSSLGCSWS